MAAPVVYHDVAPGADPNGRLFAGKKFWVAQRVFSRSRYLDLIKSNGGEVVLLEKKADYLIVDHVIQRDCPPGSISYTFIDESIKKGEIQDPEQHLTGPPDGTARAPGSLSRPAKGTRTPYTPEEDRILYKWVHHCEKTGGLASGNKIYMQLEEKYPSHTWQSWRNRYLKTLQNKPPSAFNIPDNAPPSPPSDAATAPARTSFDKPTATRSSTGSRKASGSRQVNSVEYTVEDLTAPGLFEKEDWEKLYAFATEIRECDGDAYRQAWRAWAKGRRQTAGQWRQYFEKVVWPRWQDDPDEKHERIRRRVEKRQEEEDRQEAIQAERSLEDGEDSDMGGLEAIAPPQSAPEPSASDHALDSPTPRAPRYKAPAFDTQAILSSPSQGASLNPLPLSARLTQLAEGEAEDGDEKLASDASTTESLQEFSQIVHEASYHHRIAPLAQPEHSSPPRSPASTIASTGSGDPDPPLTLDEVDEYFEEQQTEGFPNEFIAEALKHTRWRPELATEVLQAWKLEQPLPNKRGIWSESDDEEVEGGDGMALARLESKHTLDGWGGVTERLNFLAKYRSAKM